jgi:hypothetical protein
MFSGASISFSEAMVRVSGGVESSASTLSELRLTL